MMILLTALNTIFWGYTIREVGNSQLTIGFLFKLIFNKRFIFALTLAFTASLLSYAVFREISVLTGRFFLSLGAVAMIFAGTLVLGEYLTLREWISAILAIVGVLLIGRW
jgi:drug/metabolite transporter (DMT)-like permease